MLGFCEALAGVLGTSPTVAGLLVGALAGGIVIGIVGRIAMKYGIWQKAIDAPYNPQQAFTTKTPHQVVAEAATARREQGCFSLTLFLSIGVPLIAWSLHQLGLLDEALGMLWALLRSFLPGA